MSSSEDEIDFYSDPVKQLAKFNDVESSDDDDFEIKKNILSSPKIPATKITPKQKRQSKNSTKNDDLEIIENDNLEKTQKVRPETLTNESSDDFDIVENCPLNIRKNLTKKSPRQKRPMTRQQRTRLERLVTPKKSPKPRRRRKKRKQNSSIIILSDSEEPELTATNTEQIVSDVNFEHKIKVWWQSSEINEFKIRKYQKLQSIYDFYAKRDSIPLNRLIFLLNNKIIYPTDTPDTLNLEPIHIIEGGCIDEDIELRTRESTNNSSSMIQLKVQLRDRKKPLHVFIQKTEPLSVLMAKCSEELEYEMKKLRFEFDGDLLNPKDTPESLDFDGGECIDVFVK